LIIGLQSATIRVNIAKVEATAWITIGELTYVIYCGASIVVWAFSAIFRLEVAWINLRKVGKDAGSWWWSLAVVVAGLISVPVGVWIVRKDSSVLIYLRALIVKIGSVRVPTVLPIWVWVWACCACTVVTPRSSLIVPVRSIGVAAVVHTAPRGVVVATPRVAVLAAPSGAVGVCRSFMVGINNRHSGCKNWYLLHEIKFVIKVIEIK
jgi:hypothetical protein